MERLAREEAEQTLQAEREVMLAVQQMQQQQTVQRARAHVRLPALPFSSHTNLMSRRAAIKVDAQRETAEAMSEAEAAARLLSRSGMHLSESAAVAAAAGASKRQHTSGICGSRALLSLSLSLSLSLCVCVCVCVLFPIRVRVDCVRCRGCAPRRVGARL